MITSSTTGQPSVPDSTSSFTPHTIAHLRATLEGEVLFPEDAAFAGAIFCWALGVHHSPLLTVLPESAEDVVQAVTFARDHHLPVAVQATGHGIPVPCVGGMLINTSRMQGVSVNPETRTARVEAGVKWSSVVPLADQHGLATLCGSSTDIGVVGYTLGGGHGWFARKYGSAAERLLRADLVTATGVFLHVSEEEHPDLLRALRSGSGNFGIVTAIEFELIPIGQVFGGAVIYPIEHAKRIFTAFNEWLSGLSIDVTASISIMRFPPIPDLPPMLQGVACVIIRACADGDLAAGAEAIAPMRTLGQPIMDTFDVMPFTSIDAISMDPTDPVPAIVKTLMLRDLNEETITSLLAVVGSDIASPIFMVEIRYLGGDGSRAFTVADGDLSHDADFDVIMIGVAFDPEASRAVEGAMGEVVHALTPYASERVMLNFLSDSDNGNHRTRAAFSDETYSMLQATKTRYDPDNRFRFNHNIRPVQAG